MSITLEGAIIHAEDVVAEKLEKAEFIKRNPYGDKSKIQGCLDCAAEHRQLAAWLRELAERRKADSCEGCKHVGRWENEYEYGVSCPCLRCARRAQDNYESERRTDDKADKGSSC